MLLSERIISHIFVAISANDLSISSRVRGELVSLSCCNYFVRIIILRLSLIWSCTTIVVILTLISCIVISLSRFVLGWDLCVLMRSKTSSDGSVSWLVSKKHLHRFSGWLLVPIVRCCHLNWRRIWEGDIHRRIFFPLGIQSFVSISLSDHDMSHFVVIWRHDHSRQCINSREKISKLIEPRHCVIRFSWEILLRDTRSESHICSKSCFISSSKTLDR